MGISYHTAWFLCSSAMNSGSIIGEVDFSRTITLGRQFFNLSRNHCEKLFKTQFNYKISQQEKAQFYQNLENSSTPRFPFIKFSEEFIKLLQKDKQPVDSLDYSDYEEATVIHDISVPITNELKNKYSCVIDGGLLEHVYNYPVALKNAMDMVEIGGHLILVTPANNFFGHGFYQFSPELFYSVLREENGFKNTQVYLNKSNKWYLVKNPRVTHKRTEVSPKWPNVLLHVISQKVAEVPDQVLAYQSDYEDLWVSNESVSSKKDKFIATLKKVYRSFHPAIKRFIFLLFAKATYPLEYKKAFTPVDLRVNLMQR